jgi:transcriptional regulator with XRE-family HTH domain
MAGYMPKEIKALAVDYIKPLYRASRKAANLTQTELGKRLNVSVMLVSYIERGIASRHWYHSNIKFYAWLRACGVQMTISFSVVEPDPDFENYAVNEYARRGELFKKRKEKYKNWKKKQDKTGNLPENKPKSEI